MAHRGAVLVSMLAVTVAACGTPRERDCRVLGPRLEEADESTSIAGNARGDVTRVYALQAARSGAAARWLAGTSLATGELARDVAPLVGALERHAEAARRADASLRALGLHRPNADAGATPHLSALFAPETKAEAPILTEAMALNDRCGFILAAPMADQPECSALTALLAHFLEPAPGVSSSAHVADRLAELGEIHSAAPAVERALRAAEGLIRELASALVAMTADKPATETLAQLRLLAAAVNDAQAAAKEVARSSAAVRDRCRP